MIAITASEPSSRLKNVKKDQRIMRAPRPMLVTFAQVLIFIPHHSRSLFSVSGIVVKFLKNIIIYIVRKL